MEAILKKYWPLTVLLALALLAHLAFLWYPSEVVFDEVYFGSFVNFYFTHQPYFDIHPPLGKLLIFGFLKVFGASANFDYAKIGDALPASGAFMLRFLPAVSGAMLVAVVYLLIAAIGLSRRASVLGALLALLDNALLAQSKFALLDIFLILFGFLSLLFLFWFIRRPRYPMLLLAVFFSSCSASVKWTGLAFLAVIVLYLLMDIARRFNWKKLAVYLLTLVAVPVATYGLVFGAHFAALREAPAGVGALVQKIIAENRHMYQADATLTATHPYGSRWYQWPFMRRPIWYWTQPQGGATANIWLIGNPVVWFPALFAAIFLAIIGFSRQMRSALPPRTYLFSFGYGISFLPLALVSRVLFLYHYLPALVFGIIILAILYDTFIDQPGKPPYWLCGYLGLAAIGFAAILPLTYGIPLPNSLAGVYTAFVGWFL